MALSILAGGGSTTCRWRGCQKHFVRKSIRQRFCTQQCRVNFHTRKNYRKRNPIKEKTKKCKGCREFITVDSRALGPERQYCTHNCKSRHGMRKHREKKARRPSRRKVGEPPLHEVVSDGITVWVNSAWGCIGRFGSQGIDIHREPKGKGALGNECLFCTHGPVTREEWNLFVSKMLELYRVPVHDRFLPKRFR